ncbi:hypothetical protein FI667_g10203, partial [Globisporangium splendens]
MRWSSQNHRNDSVILASLQRAPCFPRKVQIQQGALCAVTDSLESSTARKRLQAQQAKFARRGASSNASQVLSAHFVVGWLRHKSYVAVPVIRKAMRHEGQEASRLMLNLCTSTATARHHSPTHTATSTTDSNNRLDASLNDEAPASSHRATMLDAHFRGLTISASSTASANLHKRSLQTQTHRLDSLRMELRRAIELEHQELLLHEKKSVAFARQATMEIQHGDGDDEGDTPLGENEGNEYELKLQERQMRRLSVHDDITNSDSEQHGEDEDEYFGDERDEDEGCFFVDSPEIATFLGMAIPSLHQNLLPPMAPKAASFSGHQYARSRSSSGGNQHHHSLQFPHHQQRMVPCSPPVPIPKRQWKRRCNNVTGSIVSSPTSRGRFLSDAGEYANYSKTQCEARLWDEDWNFKLSLESRESFEAARSRRNSTNRSPTSEASVVVWKQHSTASMASTMDTVHDDDSPCLSDNEDDDEDDHHVFAMDDLE